jgi:molybdenum cofactor biosynthesis MoaF-like protein
MMRRLVQSITAAALMSSAAVGQSATSSPSYPGPGHTYQFEFGPLTFKNEYNADGKQMTFTRLTDGHSGTVNYRAVEVRPNLFWNTWAEADGTSVARVEDFESGKVYAVVHFPDGKVANLSGTFRKLD